MRKSITIRGPLAWVALVIGVFLGSWLLLALTLVGIAALCWLAGALGL